MSNGALKLLAGAGAKDDPVYVDDVFSTFIWDGTGSSHAIDNGIDLSGEGGLVWVKARSHGLSHSLYDTERGNTKIIQSNSTGAETTNSTQITSFNNNGFTMGSGEVNYSGYNYVGWTFRKQEGFFDIVTYTGDGVAGRTVNHNLGSVPGFMVVKKLNGTSDFTTYHRSMGATKYAPLNDTDAYNTGSAIWNNTEPTATQFTVGDNSRMNADGDTYVAYLFAHDAQDFGTDSDEAIIKCGSYTGNGSSTGPTIDLGFEPQWLMIKSTGSNSGPWTMIDTMRGAAVGFNDQYFAANEAWEEQSFAFLDVTPTGFNIKTTGYYVNASSVDYVYMAIRRPHKPASEFAATNLFKTVTGRSDSTSPAYETGFVTDMGIQRRPATAESNLIFSRLTGNQYVDTDNNSDTVATDSNFKWDYMNGAVDYFSSATYRFWGWRRAPGFFDVVAYTGTGSARTISHNLGAVPEMIWIVGYQDYGERKPVYTSFSGNQKWLDLTYYYAGNADSSGAYWNSTTPTASVFSLGTQGRVNGNNYQYVAYLFASVNGISKLGSYTGTGNDLNVDCGFSNGARFVLIKTTSFASGSWFIFDSERGIASGNDPYIVLDTTAVSQDGALDAIDPLSSGFIVKGTAGNAMNQNGGTYVFYAIA